LAATIKGLSNADSQAADRLMRIGELGRRTGTRPDTIRAWERRYGLIEPARSPAGYRLYSAAEEAVVRAMRELTGQGLAAAEAAAVARRAGPVGVSVQGRGGLDPPPETTRLRVALEAFDEAGAHQVLDRSLSGLSLESVTEGVVLAAMSEIGDRWETGAVSVAQEHFASSLLRGRLLGLARGWGVGSGSLAVLACLPGELHDLGLICFGLSLRERGWRIAYLGPDTPIETLEDAAARLGPRVVVVAAQEPARLAGVEAPLAALAERTAVAVGGRAAQVLDPISGVRWLAGGPAAEAAALTVALADPASAT
jgi:MerR family transcriptional regulator, light-induced transcriptional regulator